MTNFEEKIYNAFPTCTVNKTSTAATLMSFLDLDSDLKSWLLQKFTDKDGKLNAYMLSVFTEDGYLVCEKYENLSLKQKRSLVKVFKIQEKDSLIFKEIYPGTLEELLV